MPKPYRLAVVATHPIQYQCPLWRKLAESTVIDPTVFFLSRHGVEQRVDPGFEKTFAWDVSLLDGYRHEFLSSFAMPRSVRFRRSTDCPPGQLLTTSLTGRLRQNFDAVLVHGYASGAAWAGMYGAWRTKTPVLVRGESHDRGRTPSFGQAIRRKLLANAMRRVDLVLAIGTLNKQMWRGLGVPEDRIRTSPYAIDNDRFHRALERSPERATELRCSWGAADDDVVFLFSGKLSAIKAPDVLLAAFASLPRSARAHLVFVGSGPLEEQLRQHAMGLSCVHFAGFVNQSEIPHYYRAADVLVLPSRVEPWGLVVNEAMACGTPCVVSDAVGSGPDLVEAYGSGSVFPANDIAALASRLEEALLPESRERWTHRLGQFRQQVNLDRNVDEIALAVEGVSLNRRVEHEQRLST